MGEKYPSSLVFNKNVSLSLIFCFLMGGPVCTIIVLVPLSRLDLLSGFGPPAASYLTPNCDRTVAIIYNNMLVYSTYYMLYTTSHVLCINIYFLPLYHIHYVLYTTRRSRHGKVMRTPAMLSFHAPVTTILAYPY